MSGEIIQLSETTNLIFEPMDLEVASPATVSRCGMIYLEPHMLGWEPVLKSWLNTLPDVFTAELKELMFDMYIRIVTPCLEFVRKGGFKVCVCVCVCVCVRVCVRACMHVRMCVIAMCS